VAYQKDPMRLPSLIFFALVACTPSGATVVPKSTVTGSAQVDTGEEPPVEAGSQETGQQEEPDELGDSGEQEVPDDLDDSGESDPPEEECIPSEEECDGLDNDCDGLVDGEGVCPCGFDAFGEGSYLFCDESRTWADARLRCQELGYELVVIESEEENLWIYYNALEQLGGISWIGLSDIDAEGTWLWVDGAAPMFTAWAQSEPNDWGEAGEDCAEILRWEEPTWNDANCDGEVSFICEVP
jgi:hypothetical protein